RGRKQVWCCLCGPPGWHDANYAAAISPRQRQAGLQLAGEDRFEAGVQGECEVRFPTRDVMLPFAAVHQRGTCVTFPLDRLDIAPADATHPERQPVLAQLPRVSVVIDRNQVSWSSCPVPRLPQQ